MAATTISNMTSPAIWAELVDAAFPNALSKVYDTLESTGALIVNPNLPVNTVGQTVNIPYPITLPGFVSASDGATLAIQNAGVWAETASVARYGLNPGITQWVKQVPTLGAAVLGSISNQLVIRLKEQLGTIAINAATSTTNFGQSVDVSSSGANKLNYRMLDGYIAQMSDVMGGAMENIACVITHPQSYMDLSVLGQAPDVAYFKAKPEDIYPFRFLPYEGMKTFTGMSAVTATGTTPPTITLTGTPNDAGRAFKLVVKCSTIGALNTWKLDYSTDGGNTWITAVSSASTVALNYSSDFVFNGITTACGITLNIAAGTAALDNQWVATPTVKRQTLIVAKNALLAYWNKSALNPVEFYNAQSDTTTLTSNLYAVGYRFRQCNGISRPGVFSIIHD